MKTTPLIQPLNHYLLLSPVEAVPTDKTASGLIVIPDQCKVPPIEQTVLAVGPLAFSNVPKHASYHMASGSTSSAPPAKPTRAKVGDIVLAPKFAGSDIEIDGRKMRFVEDKDILAVVQRPPATPGEPVAVKLKGKTKE